MSTEEQPSKKAKTVADEIILVCAEGTKVTIPLDHAMQCKVLAELLGDLPIAAEEVTPEVPVPAMPVCVASPLLRTMLSVHYPRLMRCHHH